MNTNQDKHICPNCGQWQHNTRENASVGLYLDCVNQCAERGFAPKVQAHLIKQAGARKALQDEANAVRYAGRAYDPEKFGKLIADFESGDVSHIPLDLRGSEYAGERTQAQEIIAEAVAALHNARQHHLATELYELRKIADQRNELLAACKRLSRWVGKGIADNSFRNCVLPKAAEADLAFAEAQIAKAEKGTN